MGIAGRYLQKAALRDPLIWEDPDPNLQLIVTIPVYNETGLLVCLDSLFRCASANTASADTAGLESADSSGMSGRSEIPATEVLILINAPADAPGELLQNNIRTFKETEKWIGEHIHPLIRFYLILDHTFTPSEAGVGLARKILMDEAVRRFERAGRIPEGKQAWRSGIIASLDADVVVDPNYLEALLQHFRGTSTTEKGGKPAGREGPDGCSIYFEHPLSPDEARPLGPESTTHPLVVFDTIARYELHLRYYVQSIRSTGYPHAFHTVGSAFAVRADIYCREGGMNRRQGGEDFYFIQKVARRGNWTDCVTTRVVPSPRPSGRVPFGTGPVVERALRRAGQGDGEGPEVLSYHPEPFRILKRFFSLVTGIHEDSPAPFDPGAVPWPLNEFLQEQQFEAALKEIRANSASPASFRKRFWRWFHMFRIMKFLHFARERGYPDVPVEEAVKMYLGDPYQSEGFEIKDLLGLFRQSDSPPQKYINPPP